MKVRMLVMVLALVALPLAGGCAHGDEEAAEGAKTLYTCPMHPEYVSDRPGSCPICGMDLVPQAELSGGAEPEAPSGHEAHGVAPAGDRPVPGVLDLGAERARQAGVRTVEAAPGRLARPIRAVGTVMADEARVRQVTTKVAGYIERLHVNVTGALVRAGDPLFELYSPELLASQQEFIRARQAAAGFESSTLPEVRRGAEELASAARQRLELFDVPPAFIARLETTGEPQRTVTFRAPFGGFVTGRSIVAGQRIEPGMELLTVTDLSRVWVMAQVYEAEAGLVRPGRAARVSLPHDPDVALNGRVEFVYPTLDPETRTLQVRVAFDNPRLVLKPGMYVDVDLTVEAADGLIVPDSAIMGSGTRSLVFVETGPGQFQARDVTPGPRANGQALIRSGLEAGERVAVSANFLLDSESRLRQAR
ncbi:MAG TPA: efflux RND transporter periplasmic adaptor subunit [Vicinamibacterales bacterium]|nr:efflux RND transporter periplasmic adaptor subunit [Vicinamibacterales bacterium]